MIFHITPPENRYDLYQIILGEASGVASTLVPVASSTVIGTFPEYITEYEYTSSSGDYYYSIMWEYSNGGFSDWSTPRMVGRTGIETSYIIVNAPSVSSVYIMNPVSGDVPYPTGNWLSYNKEYYITIDSTLSGGLTWPMEADYQFTFTSRYCPLFSSVNEVRYEAGDFINNLMDDTINRIIHKNSTYIINRYVNLKGAIPTNYTCDGSLLNVAFKRYVTCKSALDSITATQLSTGGNALKKLGDMTIQYGGINAKTDPNNKKQELKECIDSTLSVIFSGFSFKMGVIGKDFIPLRHPMSDPSFGRLSVADKNYEYNWESKFDETLYPTNIIVGSGS